MSHSCNHHNLYHVCFLQPVVTDQQVTTINTICPPIVQATTTDTITEKGKAKPLWRWMMPVTRSHLSLDAIGLSEREQ
ncbi:hypothetical protein PROFUN_00153 [Planoprotostelium fungivorum]|uniref:Uncharacterized protein n=1 Tax=Planoprotostelium fungivorum TaxID=1890364 RepID=A0A2P6P0S5_9EUKA|nr:hypothetical protein PROFUN_00153 [Planoprotostelium fungivorum]